MLLVEFGFTPFCRDAYLCLPVCNKAHLVTRRKYASLQMKLIIGLNIPEQFGQNVNT